MKECLKPALKVLLKYEMKLSLAEKVAASCIWKQAVDQLILPTSIGAPLLQLNPLATICNSMLPIQCVCFIQSCVYEAECVCLTLNHLFNTAFIEVGSHKLNSATGVREIFWKLMIQLEFMRAYGNVTCGQFLSFY